MNHDDVLKVLTSLSKLGMQVSIDEICINLANFYDRKIFCDEVRSILDEYVKGGCVRKVDNENYIPLV